MGCCLLCCLPYLGCCALFVGVRCVLSVGYRVGVLFAALRFDVCLLRCVL